MAHLKAVNLVESSVESMVVYLVAPKEQWMVETKVEMTVEMLAVSTVDKREVE